MIIEIALGVFLGLLLWHNLELVIALLGITVAWLWDLVKATLRFFLYNPFGKGLAITGALIFGISFFPNFTMGVLFLGLLYVVLHSSSFSKEKTQK